MLTTRDTVPVVEFLGLPGSGKTTLVQSLLMSPELEAHDLVSAVLLERGNRARKTLVAMSRILPKITKRVSRKHLALRLSPPLSQLSRSFDNVLEQAQNERSRHLIGQTLRMYAALGHTSLNVYVEEGVFQRLYWANPDLNPSEAFSGCPRVGAVVFLNTPPETAITRLRRRLTESGSWGVRRYRGKSEADVFSDLQRNHAYNLSGIESLADSQRVLEIDGTARPNDVRTSAELLLSGSR